MAAAFGWAALQQGVKDTSEFGWGQLGSIINTKRQWGATKNAQKESYKNLREGLRRAGYNPILALGGKPGAGGGGNVPSQFQRGDTPGVGTLGGSSAKELATLTAQKQILTNQAASTKWQAIGDQIGTLDKLRRFNALSGPFARGEMDKPLMLKEFPGFGQAASSSFMNEVQKLLGGTDDFSAKEYMKNFPSYESWDLGDKVKGYIKRTLPEPGSGKGFKGKQDWGNRR